jgi:asparagine synthetase B (glutamine-hydrolysing)
VLPPRPVVSLPNLGLLLANPSLELCYVPRSVWAGVRMRRAIAEWPAPHGGGREELPGRFRGAVERAMGASDPVAVTVSGGLDSLAVLWHAGALCRQQGRRLVAIVADLVDDRGVSSADVVRRLVSTLGLSCELEVLPEDDTSPSAAPAWSPVGPRFDAMPDVCRRISDRAAARGAAVLLTGRGSDELLMCSRFTGLDLVRRRRYRDLGRYVSDMTYFDGAKGCLGEVAGLVSPRLSRPASFALLYAFMWPEAHEPDPGGILGPGLREVAAEHHREWFADEQALAEACGFDWSRVAARHAVYPRDHIAPPGRVPWLSPFLDADFAAYAHGLALADRYDRGPKHAYHRLKAPVLALFPASLRDDLPPAKQTFARACARYFERRLREPPRHCLELGLVSHRWRGALVADERLVPVLHSVETWLAEALSRGAGTTLDTA